MFSKFENRNQMLFLFLFVIFLCLNRIHCVAFEDFQQSVDLSSESLSVHCIRSIPLHKKGDVLLLHGAKFSAKTWET